MSIKYENKMTQAGPKPPPESTNAQYETFKAVADAEKSMAIKSARGGTSVKNADGGKRRKRII